MAEWSFGTEPAAAIKNEVVAQRQAGALVVDDAKVAVPPTRQSDDEPMDRRISLIEAITDIKFPHYKEARLVIESAARLLGVAESSERATDHLRDVVGAEKVEYWLASRVDVDLFAEEPPQPIGWRTQVVDWILAASAFERSLTDWPVDELDELLERVGHKSRRFEKIRVHSPGRQVVIERHVKPAEAHRPARFDYWLSKPSRTVDEATFLSMGLEPRLDGGNVPAWRRYNDFRIRHDLLQRAVIAGDPKKLTPSAILAWARKRNDFKCPPELLSISASTESKEKSVTGIERRTYHKFIVYLLVSIYPKFNTEYDRESDGRTNLFVRIRDDMADKGIYINKDTIETVVLAAIARANEAEEDFFRKSPSKRHF